MSPGNGRESELSPGERAEFEAIRSAVSLADLMAALDADTQHGAYLKARPIWQELRSRELAIEEPLDGLSG